MDIIPLSELHQSHRQLIGGKGYALGQLISQGYTSPRVFALPPLCMISSLIKLACEI